MFAIYGFHSENRFWNRTILLSYEKCVILRIEHTPGFHIMRIHLVRYLTSARVENNPQNFTYCEFIQLVQIKRHCLLSKNSLSAKFLLKRTNSY